MLVLSAVIAMPSAVLQASAAALVDINDPSVFLKQQYSDTCTLCANVMLLRRAALLSGDTGWSSITESAMRPLVWNETYGMYNYYTYKGYKVSFEKTANPNNSSAELIEVLKRHPEGIVAYDYDHPHAILLTDYTNGVFYCAEPANSVASGRINASRALVRVNQIEAYWYLESPDLSSLSPGTTAARWEITAEDGVNIRSGPGLSYRVVGGAVKGAVVSVVATKQADGYTWGSVTHNGVTGWLVLDYAKRLDDGGLVNSSTLSYSRIEAGETVTLRAKASGGSGSYTYNYYYRMPSSSNWVAIETNTTAKTAAYIPKTTGTYTLRVTVRDKVSGAAVNKELSLSVNGGLTNVSGLSRSAITLHSTVKVTGSGSGGTGKYQYAYYVKKTSSSSWTTLKAYSTSASVTFTPASAQEYLFLVRVKDALGKTAEKQLKLSVNPALVNKSKVSPSAMSYGEPVTLTGEGSGGTGSCQYAYFCKKTGSNSWYTIQALSARSSVTYTFKHTGTYDICVHVKDSTGVVAKKYLTVTVYPTLRNRSSVAEKTILKGEELHLTGSATGGTGTYQFAYYCRKQGNTGWYTIMKYSDETEIAYAPRYASAYEVRIKVKDSRGTVRSKTFTVQVKKSA